jgi:hypothetical protein
LLLDSFSFLRQQQLTDGSERIKIREQATICLLYPLVLSSFVSFRKFHNN